MNSFLWLFCIYGIVLLGLFFISFFIFGIIYRRKNKNYKDVGEKIPYEKFFSRIFLPLLPFYGIVFCIHLLIILYHSIAYSLSEEITTGNVPFLKVLVDFFRSLMPVMMPFVVPAIIILGLYIIVGGIIGGLTKKLEKEGSTPSENFFYFCTATKKATFSVIKFLPKIIFVVGIFIGINMLFVSVRNITKVFDNMEKIKELNLVVKNLSRSERVAKITLVNATPEHDYGYLKTYKFESLDSQGNSITSEEITLKGDEIAIDFININFDYSQIANGDTYTIAYPYRIYSEYMAPKEGIELQSLYKDEKVPAMFFLSEDNIYGLNKDSFYGRLRELFTIIGDEVLRKEMGIRSAIGNVPHFIMKEGEVYYINVEGTGGLSVKKYINLF